MNGLLIGRFQPFHFGHLEAVLFALSKVDNLWIGIGSSNRSNEQKNPFTADERKSMIESSIEQSLKNRVQIYFIPDTNDHAKWTFSIDSIVPDYGVVFSNDEFTKTLYQKRGIEVISVPLKNRKTLSGTSIRSNIAKDQNLEGLVPTGTQTVLKKINARDRLKIFNYK